MSVAKRIQQFMEDHGVQFDVLVHRPTPSSSKTAQASHITGHHIAKGVVLKDDEGYALAVVPASRHVQLHALQEWQQRNFTLASEEELGEIFVDCELGAVPAIGDAYGIKVLIDDSLAEVEDIYFEAGDHKCLLHVRKPDFDRLMENAEYGHFSSPV